MFNIIRYGNPVETPGFTENPRGTSYCFGPDITDRFLSENSLDLIARSFDVEDQVTENGNNG